MTLVIYIWKSSGRKFAHERVHKDFDIHLIQILLI